MCAEKGIGVFDFAQDYGLGKAQPMMGEFGCDSAIVSSKYTPFTKYKAGKIRKSLERDLKELVKVEGDFVFHTLKHGIHDPGVVTDPGIIT